LINREQIFAEAKKHGLEESGFNFIDRDFGLVVNSAYLISKVRKLSEKIGLEEAFIKFLEMERKKSVNQH
jgi:hypothetical protein